MQSKSSINNNKTSESKKSIGSSKTIQSKKSTTSKLSGIKLSKTSKLDVEAISNQKISARKSDTSKQSISKNAKAGQNLNKLKEINGAIKSYEGTGEYEEMMNGLQSQILRQRDAISELKVMTDAPVTTEDIFIAHHNSMAQFQHPSVEHELRQLRNERESLQRTKNSMLEQQDLRRELDNGFREIEMLKADIIRTILDHVKISTMAQFPFPMPPIYPPQPPQVAQVQPVHTREIIREPIYINNAPPNVPYSFREEKNVTPKNDRSPTKPKTSHSIRSLHPEEPIDVEDGPLSERKKTHKSFNEPVPVPILEDKEGEDKEEISMMISPDTEKKSVNDENDNQDKETEEDDLLPYFELLIDGSRFLTDNVNVSKIYVFFMNSAGEKISEPEEALQVLDTDIYHPEYNFRVVVMETKYMVPDLIAYILTVTFDDMVSNPEDEIQLLKIKEKSSNCVILGLSMLNLYKDMETGAEAHFDTLDWDPNVGAHELPINLPEYTKFDFQELLSKKYDETGLRRYFGSSMLVRINKLTKEEALDPDRPFIFKTYEEAGYVPEFDLGPNEEELMKLLANRVISPGIKIGEELMSEFDLAGLEEQKAEGRMEEFIESVYSEFFQQTRYTSLVDTLGAYRYEVENGFYIGVDNVFNISHPGVIVSAIIIVTNDKIHDPIIFSDINWNGPKKVIEYKDPLAFVNISQILEPPSVKSNQEEEPNLEKKIINCVITLFNITYTNDSLDVDHQGFGILPLGLDEGFIHGVFQVPIFNEGIEHSLFFQLQRMDGWNQLKGIMDDTIKTKKKIKVIENSFTVRVMAKELHGMYDKKNDFDIINKMLLSDNFNQNSIATHQNYEWLVESSGTIQDLQPDGYDIEEVKESMNHFFQEFFEAHDENDIEKEIYGGSEQGEGGFADGDDLDRPRTPQSDIGEGELDPNDNNEDKSENQGEEEMKSQKSGVSKQSGNTEEQDEEG